MYKRLLLNDQFILGVILLNAAVIFAQGFSPSGRYAVTLEILDNLFTVVFFLEAIAKIRAWGRKGYFNDGWNIFDFLLVLLALPSLLIWIAGLDMTTLEFLLVFRTLRVLKFFRLIRFVPNIDHIFDGVGRAAKASILLVFVFFIFNFIVSMVACFLFKEMAPDYFGNPLQSFYSIFKVFTVEGWFEVPDAIADEAPPIISFFIRFFFIVIFFFGGVLGLSIVNSIFVDSMVADNNDALEEKVLELQRKIDILLDRSKNGRGE